MTPSKLRSSPRTVIVACLVGTSLEWYDFFLYGTASALIFPQLFFPTFDPLVGTLLAFATYAMGFVARPLGGVVFGHFGDRAGRKWVLMWTLLLMGGATFLIGALPTYAVIGVTAPLLLVALRFVQGIGLGGEWGGAVLMSLEHGDPARRGFTAGWPQVGVPMGNLLAAGVLGLLNLVLSEEAFLSWGWRVAFFLSGALVGVGIWVRGRNVEESSLFAEVKSRGETAELPLVEVVRRHPRELLVAMGARVGTDVAFYTFTVYILTFVTTNLELPRSVGLTAVLVASACQLALIPLFGALSDRYGRRPVYTAGAVGAAVWAFVFFPLLSTRSTVVIVAATVVALVTHAAMYGPQAAFIAELFSTRLRYSGVAGLPDRRGVRGCDRADRVDRVGWRVRHGLRGVVLRAGDARPHAGRARVRARDRQGRPPRRRPGRCGHPPAPRRTVRPSTCGDASSRSVSPVLSRLRWSAAARAARGPRSAPPVPGPASRYSSASRSDVRPALTPRVLEQLRALVEGEDVTDGPGGRGVPAIVSSADGRVGPIVDLTPRRPNCQVEHGPQRDRLVEENLTTLAASVASVTATEPGLDLVQGVADAVAGRDPGLLVVVSHGLSTRGAVDLRQVGWRADPAQVVAQLRGRGLLPSGLAGWKVVWVGLGATSGDQAPLPFPARGALESYWRAICTAAGAASCVFDDTRLPQVRSAATAVMPVVDVEGVSSVLGPDGGISATVSDEVLGFDGDSADTRRSQPCA